MRYVFAVTDDATLCSAGDSPPHLGEYFLGRLGTCNTPPLGIIFCAGFLCSGIFFILVSFIFIHLIKYQTTYISLQALFSLTYFDRSFLSSPKYLLKYLDRILLSSNLAFCQMSPRWNHFLDWCLFFYVAQSVICSGTIQYFNLLSSLSQHCELSLKSRLCLFPKCTIVTQKNCKFLYNKNDRCLNQGTRLFFVMKKQKKTRPRNNLIRSEHRSVQYLRSIDQHF